MKTKMKQEALKRMRRLGLMESVINDFQGSERLYYSEPTPLGGILYWLDNEPEWEELVKEWEKKTENLVYHAIHGRTEFGEILSLLYVSRYDEEWEMDNWDIENGVPIAHVLNLTNPSFSETGSIGVRSAAGGLIRTQ